MPDPTTPTVTHEQMRDRCAKLRRSGIPFGPLTADLLEQYIDQREQAEAEHARAAVNSAIEQRMADDGWQVRMPLT